MYETCSSNRIAYRKHYASLMFLLQWQSATSNSSGTWSSDSDVPTLNRLVKVIRAAVSVNAYSTGPNFLLMPRDTHSSSFPAFMGLGVAISEKNPWRERKRERKQYNREDASSRLFWRIPSPLISLAKELPLAFSIWPTRASNWGLKGANRPILMIDWNVGAEVRHSNNRPRRVWRENVVSLIITSANTRRKITCH